MVFKIIIELSKKIEINRNKLSVLSRNKGQSDPDVIKVSQELDKEIIALQKAVNTFSSPS